MVKFLLCSLLALHVSAGEISNDFEKISDTSLWPQTTLITGSLITIFLVGNRDDSDKIQHNIHRDNILGEYSKYGDYMGRLVPNLTYILYKNFKSSKTNDKYFKARNAMFKATLYSGLFTGILKRVFNQKRPHRGDSLSFPSGHTTTAFAFAGVVSHFENMPATIGSYTIATLVGISRMNDNAHYLHDVVFGATIGLGFAHIFSRSTPKKSSLSITPYIDSQKSLILITKNF